MRIHIHAPQPSRMKRERRKCPVCEKRALILYEFTDWYGWYGTCLACGDTWANGELLPRPFKPRWRRERIEDAKKRWKQWQSQLEVKGVEDGTATVY